MEKYKAKDGSQISDKQAEIYGKQLDAIMKTNGFITPPLVVQDARRTNSPLHDYFDWDNKEAAEKWRLTQAGDLIRSITVEIISDDEPKEIRAYFSVSSTKAMDTESSQVYVSLATVKSNTEMREEVIAYALRELKSWRERYKQYSELSEITEFIARHT